MSLPKYHAQPIVSSLICFISFEPEFHRKCSHEGENKHLVEKAGQRKGFKPRRQDTQNYNETTVSTIHYITNRAHLAQHDIRTGSKTETYRSPLKAETAAYVWLLSYCVGSGQCKCYRMHLCEGALVNSLLQHEETS